MLLDDIIEVATNDAKPVSGLLRKCLVLGHRLKNGRLISWANQELNGYDLDEDLPTYRVVPAGAKAYMSGPFGMSINNFSIPSMLMREQHRDFATTAYLREAISAYEELMRANSDGFKIEWPADLVLLYQKEIRTQNGCHLAQAWQPLSKGKVAEVIDAVRNRTLNMALEIRTSLGGDDNELDKASSQAAASIERTVTNNIYGGVNVIASGRSSINSSISNVLNTIQTGDKEKLDTALRSLGIPDSSLNDLSTAIHQDGGTKLGSRVKAWVRENAAKALVGGVKVGASAAQSVITEYMKQFFGL